MDFVTCYEKDCPLRFRASKIKTIREFRERVLDPLFECGKECLVCRYFIRPDVPRLLDRLRKGDRT